MSTLSQRLAEQLIKGACGSPTHCGPDDKPRWEIWVENLPKALEEAFHSICHDLPPDTAFNEFCDGCIKEQIKLFGKAREEELQETLTDVIRTIRSGRLVSIGSVANTFLPQVSVEQVKRWEATLVK